MQYRLPLLIIAIISLIFGVLAGLSKMGWHTAVFRADLPSIHGPLMIAGFLGTLISLERAVAMDRVWAYSVPGINAIGLLFLLTGISHAGGSLLLIAGSAGLVLILGIFLYRQPALFSVTLVSGALSLVAGNFLFFLDYPVYILVFWWIAFLVLTIAGERLELSRLVKISIPAQTAFFIIIIIFFSGLFWAARLAGIAMLAISLWLLRYDVATRTFRYGGLPQFVAFSMMSGNIWLGIGGLLTFFYGNTGGGPYYDASLHSILLGFVFAMVFGHAPIIFPAVTGIAIPFRNRFYIHLAILQISILIRLVGDFTGNWSAILWGGMLNAIAILTFLGNTVSAAVLNIFAGDIKKAS